MRKKIARVVSVVLNPFGVSLAIVLVLSFESTASIIDALRWSALLIGVSIVPVYVTIIYMAKVRGLGQHFVNIRQKRNVIYIIASFFGLAGLVALWALSAPLLLRASYVVAISTVVMFMGINFWWKISVHTAFVAATLTVLIIIHGAVAAVGVVLLPLVIWARLELAYHSKAQVSAGASLAILTVIVVYNIFGLI